MFANFFIKHFFVKKINDKIHVIDIKYIKLVKPIFSRYNSDKMFIFSITLGAFISFEM